MMGLKVAKKKKEKKPRAILYHSTRERYRGINSSNHFQRMAQIFTSQSLENI
jgi:hypothetical protein